MNPDDLNSLLVLNSMLEVRAKAQSKAENLLKEHMESL